MTCLCSLCGQVVAAPDAALVLVTADEKRAMEYDQLVTAMAHHLDSRHREDTAAMLAAMVATYGQGLIANFFQSSDGKFSEIRQARRDAAWWTLSSRWDIEAPKRAGGAI